MLAINKISITCDFWSDRSSKSYLCITGHYVTYEFDHISTILSFDSFFDRHFGIRIAKIIKEKLSNLNLINNLVSFTTDGAANMRTMCEHLKDIQFHWIWCIGHRYHLTINNALGFWGEKKKKKKKKKQQIEENEITTDNVHDGFSNNDAGDQDQATGPNGSDIDEEENMFWDDATKGKIQFFFLLMSVERLPIHPRKDKHDVRCFLFR